MCGKRWAFDTKEQAQAALPGIPEDRAGRKPNRTYKCRGCGKWLLTSHPREKPNKRGRRH